MKEEKVLLLTLCYVVNMIKKFSNVAHITINYLMARGKKVHCAIVAF